LLEAASVQGPEFDAAAVARAAARDPADVEERLEALDHLHGLVRLVREHEFPDSTLTLRYAFVHGVYRRALHDRLPPPRRAALSLAAAEALLAMHRWQGSAAAAELAPLFEAGRDFARAAEHYLLAAENAARRFAHADAVTLARRGLAALRRLPE